MSRARGVTVSRLCVFCWQSNGCAGKMTMTNSELLSPLIRLEASFTVYLSAMCLYVQPITKKDAQRSCLTEAFVSHHG